MFMGKRFIFDALGLRLLFFFWRMIRYSLIWGMKNMKNFRLKDLLIKPVCKVKKYAFNID